MEPKAFDDSTPPTPTQSAQTHTKDAFSAFVMYVTFGSISAEVAQND
jgi:hypothetical protein